MRSLLKKALLFIFIVTSLTACGDSRERTKGSADAWGQCAGTHETIVNSAAALGPAYASIRDASLNSLESIKAGLNYEQLKQYDNIGNALKYYIDVIEREPATEVAIEADKELVVHQNFISFGSPNFPRWMDARKRMPIRSSDEKP